MESVRALDRHLERHSMISPPHAAYEIGKATPTRSPARRSTTASRCGRERQPHYVPTGRWRSSWNSVTRPLEPRYNMAVLDHAAENRARAQRQAELIVTALADETVDVDALVQALSATSARSACRPRRPFHLMPQHPFQRLTTAATSKFRSCCRSTVPVGRCQTRGRQTRPSSSSSIRSTSSGSNSSFTSLTPSSGCRDNQLGAARHPHGAEDPEDPCGPVDILETMTPSSPAWTSSPTPAVQSAQFGELSSCLG